MFVKIRALSVSALPVAHDQRRGAARSDCERKIAKLQTRLQDANKLLTRSYLIIFYNQFGLLKYPRSGHEIILLSQWRAVAAHVRI